MASLQLHCAATTAAGNSDFVCIATTACNSVPRLARAHISNGCPQTRNRRYSGLTFAARRRGRRAHQRAARCRRSSYRLEVRGSSLNDFSTASRSNMGSVSPPLAISNIRLATIVTAGSLRSTRPKARKASSNAVVRTATSSGEKAPLPKRTGRIGITPTPEPRISTTSAS